MTHTTTIADPHEPDAMPLWESFDHATAENAYAAARDHIAAAQPDDRIVDQGSGVYAVLSGADLGAAQVATIVISPDDETPAAPTTDTH
ncbi:hypothetical protein [Mycolicibacterium grossiae]|uniref:Uncharacterized protein n=1 Tax=Mycolicibacterium grossiae TaxID=1552759 RepID=A0A1E8PX50_9MYCO|nr:hypothetical protein [Mycolicibacterium grossiae]OFJ50893.1 hypothetical protein BEL07_25675 [Mycolicibacterium grossiae]QEM45686.1 hypothetical protein FZ046_13740 [Mycolicibacterium grossiae]